jgi:putative transcriptional regulator
VASPALGDDNFHRTVVLVLEHGTEGAVGVVLNRPSHTQLEQIAAPLAPLAAPPGMVHVGGPVAPSAAICLGRIREGTEGPGASRLFGRLASVDLDVPAEELGELVDRIRLFAGYAGWDAGQLDAEMAQGAWFAVKRSDEDALCPDPTGLWRAVLRRQRRQSLAMLASYPDDPANN